jgi:hypothetical protein
LRIFEDEVALAYPESKLQRGQQHEGMVLATAGWCDFSVRLLDVDQNVMNNTQTSLNALCEVSSVYLIFKVK